MAVVVAVVAGVKHTAGAVAVATVQKIRVEERIVVVAAVVVASGMEIVKRIAGVVGATKVQQIRLVETALKELRAVDMHSDWMVGSRMTMS